jgi:ribosome biogenesis GTPase
MLPSGGMVIDTPGMRELQLWNGEEGTGMQEAFGDVESFAALCRFRDCTHTKEPGCGVKAALNDGRLETKRYESYLKLKRELLFTESKQNQAIRLMQKKRNKEFGKLAKELKKDKIF